MHKLKGFIHIVEIIVISMMAFFLLVQFYQIPKNQEDWGKADLSAQANDILFSLEKKGVNWFDSVQVNSSLYNLVSGSTIYDLRIRNAPKPAISVGCICSGVEKLYLENALKSYEVNGHGTRFIIDSIDPFNMAFSHKHDVIVNFDYDLGPYLSQIRQFLAAGKGLVEFRHLDQTEVQGNSVQEDFFGLEWNSSLPDVVTASVDFRSNSSTEPYYNIYKYLHHLSLYQENFSYGSAGWVPEPAMSWNVNIWQNYVGSGAEAGSYYSEVFNDTYSMRVSLKFDTSTSKAEIMLYRLNPDTYIAVILDAENDRVIAYKNDSGYSEIIGRNDSVPLDTSSWYDVKIVPQPDGRLKIYIDESLVLTTQPIFLTGERRIDVAVITDLSGSMGSGSGKLNNAKNAIIQFMNAMLTPPASADNTMGLSSYSSGSINSIALTRDTTALANEVNSYSAGGYTCISCGIENGTDTVRLGSNPVKALLLMTDGQANRCIPGIECTDPEGEAIQKAADAWNLYGISIYAVAFGGDADVDTMQQIADVSHGNLYLASETNIDDVYLDIAGEMTNSMIENSQIALGVVDGTVRFDNVYVSLAEMHSFTTLLSSQNDKVQPKDDEMRKVILAQDTELPFCVVNSNMAGGLGRAAWLSAGTMSGVIPSESQEKSSMLRSLVLWASGDENPVIRGEIKSVPVVASIYKTYDQEMFQPVEVVLTMGNVYV